MNRTRTGAVVSAAALTVAAGIAAVAVTGPADAGTSTTPTSFSARIYHGSETNLDLGKSGFSAGDQDLFTGSIVRAGNRIGHLVGTCQTVRAGSTGVQLCSWTLRLSGGQIVASGSVVAGPHGPGTFALAVVGGTGRYRDAAGEVSVTASDGPIPIMVDLD